VTNVKWEKMSQDAAKELEELIQPFACQKKSMFGYDVSTVICSPASSRAASFSGCLRHEKKQSRQRVKIIIKV
jgi:hypothetical protein